MSIRRTAPAILIALILLVALAATVAGQTIWETARNLRVTNLETLTSLDSAGIATFDTLTAVTAEATDINITGAASLEPATAISVTNGATLTLASGYQPLTSAGTVTMTLAAPTVAGQIVILANTSNTTINMADSGTVRLSAAWAAGQHDTLTLIGASDLAAWAEVARSNN